MASHLVLAADWGMAALSLVLGAALGAAGLWLIARGRAGRLLADKKAEGERSLREASLRADEIVKNAEVEGQKRLLEAMERFEQETSETRAEIKTAEKRIANREDSLDKKMDVLLTKERAIESAESKLADREKVVVDKTAKVDEMLAQQRAELLRISKLTPDDAKALCLKRFEAEVESEAGEIFDRLITTAEENARERARYITIGAIQRYAAEHTCEAVVATVDVPSDEMKGRVIGREGRNIRAFEKTTGVTVVVDDTPGIVSISCFDPVRKEIARMSLDRLIRDGRIHPTRIEEIVAEVTKEIDNRVVEAGRQAAQEAQVNGVNKKVLDVLGRLQFRTSYGQNVLRHSIEVAYLCGLMASELGLDPALARRCGLLHDVGKALDHEMEGSHTKTGSELARRYNEPPAVINAIGGHHGDIPATHPYTPLVTSADAISAARPGGRRESLERYIKRLEDLEKIATSFNGVRQAYAIEAGREIRVIVDAMRVDDHSSLKLAHDIARKIEDEMQTFPGEIKVTVLREVRATEFAISGRAHRREEERV
ncbi:Ribonuclease Y [Phycisphaerae bacterium RAS1]|nr:Ribonuclease Y [Phycisphaerae bacterium RAS1]